MNYAIVDIETTGGAGGGRVTEVAVLITDGVEIIQHWQSLVNPGISVPYNISLLTGITDAMLEDAPTFSDIATDLKSLLDNAVFVAHSVAFDYGVLKAEFARCNLSLNVPRLCTVRLSRKIFPGLPSYSLGRLCNSLGIEITDRHRAFGDAEATSKVFHLLMEQNAAAVFQSLKQSNREFTLPPALDRKVVLELPPLPGIYYFEDESGKIIYIGKAKNIQQRVWSHFRDYSLGKHRMKDRIAHVDFELSGTELLAELMESAAIKKHYPEFNRAQKQVAQGYGICTYTDSEGRLRADIALRSNKIRLLGYFANKTAGFRFLENLCKQENLCKHACGICSFEFCRMAECALCSGLETAESHNERLLNGLEKHLLPPERQILPLNGRHHGEKAFLWIEGGLLRGYGFVPADAQVSGEYQLEDYLIVREHNNDIQRILMKAGILISTP